MIDIMPILVVSLISFVCGWHARASVARRSTRDHRDDR